MTKYVLVVLGASSLLGLGCGGNHTVRRDGGGSDAGPSDQKTEAARPDLAGDTARESTPDSAPDTTPDSAPDLRADGADARDTGPVDTYEAPAPTFTVGGTITGLTGGGLVLQNNAGDNLTVTAGATTFTFGGRLAGGAAYAVTVLTQPTAPSQTCTVAAGSGNLGNADVTSVAITCVTRTFTVGGTISGLTGTGLVLRNNGGDDLTVTAGATAFTFATSVASGSPFAVVVQTQPSAPTQTCVVAGGTGTVGAADVASVTVNCTVNTYTVGGTISGLAGTVVLRNSGGDDRSLTASGTFAFATPVASGAPFAVTVFTQPTVPSQTCTVTAGTGTGTVGAANVTSVVVACVTNRFAVKAAVSGLAGTGLHLLNGSDDLAVAGDGTVTFATSVASGDSYAVSVSAQPSALSQTCVVTSGGSGAITSADVTAQITCTTNSYAVRATVSGLAGTGLRVANGTDSVAVSADGTVTVSAAVTSGGSYAVSVAAQPAGPTQTCVVSSGGSGTVSSASVTAQITCTTNRYAVKATVSGLAGAGLRVANGTDSVAVGASGTVTVSATVASGASYAVSVAAQPAGPTQTCVVSSGGSGTVTSADVTAQITCTTNQYAVKAAVTGLSGTGLMVANGTDAVAVAADGTVTVSAAIASGASYAVSVSAQPAGQTCTTTAPASGTVAAADLTVAITCVANKYKVRGTIAGATGSITLHNGAENLTVPSGAFAFVTEYVDGTAYAVTITAANANTCTLTGASGTLAGADAVVTINCHPTASLVYYFPFDGDANDASGGGHHGTVNGAVLTADRNGLADRAYAFDGGSSWIEAPGDALPISGSARTLTAWVKPAYDQGIWGIIHWGDGDCFGLMFGIALQGNAGFWGGCNDFISGLSIPVDTWSFVSVRFTPPNTVQVRVNADAESATIGDVDTTPSTLWIGAETTDNGNFRNYFGGALDSIRIYDVDLSDAEIDTIYNSLP